MKKDTVNKYLVILIYLFVTLGVLIGASFLLTPVKNKNISKERLKKYSGLVSELKDLEETEFEKGIITEKLQAKNSDNKTVSLYDATLANGYGDIQMIVAVLEDGTILGISANVNQSIGASLTKTYVEGYKGSKINQPTTEITAPTVSFSLDTANAILEEISKSHGIVEEKLTIYEELFGKDYTEEEQTKPDLENIKGYKTILVNGEVLAHVYHITGLGIYNEQEKASIDLNIILSPDYTILGAEELEYKHTGGGFKKKVFAYIDELADAKVKIGEVETFVSDVTGATNSRTLVKEMLVELSKFLLGGE